MSVDPDRQRTSFGSIAHLYDTVRPGYPTAVGERILSCIVEPRAISCLEVGCGSGQATMLFALAGINILAIDISAELIALGKKRLAGFPNVQFQVSAFESFEARNPFDLVYSAQAFHWIPSAVGLPHAARLLKAAGRLALFWNFFNYDADPTLRQLRESIIRHVPLFARYPEGSSAEFDSFRTQWVGELRQSGYFKNVSSEICESTKTYTFEDYLVLLSSYSWFQTQPATIQQDLMSELRAVHAATMPQLDFLVQTLLITAENAKSI